MRGSVRSGDDLTNVFEVPSVRLRRNVEVDFRAGDPAPERLLHAYLDVVEPKPSWEGAKPIRLETDAHEGAQGHIAGNAGKGVENGYGHEP